MVDTMRNIRPGDVVTYRTAGVRTCWDGTKYAETKHGKVLEVFPSMDGSYLCMWIEGEGELITEMQLVDEKATLVLWEGDFGEHRYTVAENREDAVYVLEKTVMDNQPLRFNKAEHRMECLTESGVWDVYISDSIIREVSIVDKDGKTVETF